MSEDEDVSSGLDAITDAQRRLDDMAVMFYTYTGIIQRDAPPTARVPDELDELPADEAARSELLSKIPDYANDILRASKDMSAAIDRISRELETDHDKRRAALASSDDKSVQAGVQLKDAASAVETLLAELRQAVAHTETEADFVVT